jgi:predicted metal-dependent peptidase
MTKIESLAKASKELMLKEPFYGLLLMSLNKVWNENIPTAGVCLKGINYQLAINSKFWEELPLQQKVGILKHELLHIGFFHLVNYEKYSDKKRLNIAMDLEINQYIERDWLPEGGMFLDTFPNLKLGARMGTKYYYDKLEENSEDEDVKSCMDGMNNGDTEVTLSNGDNVNLPDHDFKDVESLPEATKKLIESQTEHIVKQVAEQVQKTKGNIPGEFSEILERLNKVEKAKFDWKGYIRRFTGKSVKTYTKKSRRKYNKRLPDFPGLKIKRHKHILAAIDTSGSVSTSELQEFLGELYHLNKTGSDVTICQCDTAISYIGPFDPKKDMKIHGRGGTNFQPVIDYYNENQRKFSCLMYFTDGEAYAPEDAKGSILWVLSSNGDKSYLEGTYGELIQLEK